jgi:hypothetical protein
MPVTLSISVTGIAQVLLSFDTIRVKRSITGVDGTYNLLTDLAPDAAFLLAPTSGNYNVSGKTLQVLSDQDAQVDILFTGTDPLTTAQVVSQVNTALGDVIASDVSNALQLTSTLTGTVSKVEIVGGSAATEFGWSAGDRDIGFDAHITLQAGVTGYNYTDSDGQSGYFYKVNFYNTTTALTSADSSPFEGDVGTLVSEGTLSDVKIDLIDGRGIALPDQDVTFYPMHELLEVEGFQIGLARAPTTITTNNSGHAEVSLVRGSRWRVSFDGTSIIRDITIPDEEETDLMAVLGAAPDPFDIKTLLINPAIRRSV